MRQCSFDLDKLRDEMGEHWEPYVAYNLELASSPSAKVAGRLMREFGLPRIQPDDLARITVPTALIWGRQDRANTLRIAETASARYGWALHVIEDCADDPPRDRPEAFLEALRAVLGPSARQVAAV
jgi:pimeloyl-ACP methyl ester carboxylesterase